MPFLFPWGSWNPGRLYCGVGWLGSEQELLCVMMLGSAWGQSECLGKTLSLLFCADAALSSCAKVSLHPTGLQPVPKCVWAWACALLAWSVPVHLEPSYTCCRQPRVLIPSGDHSPEAWDRALWAGRADPFLYSTSPKCHNPVLAARRKLLSPCHLLPSASLPQLEGIM